MKLEEVFLNDLAQSNLVDVDRPPMRIDITGVGQPTPPEEVGPAPADDLTAMATEMAGGMEPEGATPMSVGEFATSMADVPAGLLKGAVQGTIGLPGDIESLAYGVRELLNRGADETRIGAFVRGLGEKTILPTTEDVKKWIDTNVGPLVPEGADQRRVDAAKIPEFVGELGGAGKTVIEGTKAAARETARVANTIGDKTVQAITGNPQATAMGVLEEAGQMSPLSRIVPGVQPQAAPQRSDIGFYSAVEKAVLDSKQEKGTGAQFLAQITKTQGVKPEELKWTGLDEFLKGKKSVTKAEIQDYLNANRVDVREVRLGDYSKYGLEDMWEAASNRTKFSQYTLPGGENYREILLTLPIQAKGTSRYEVRPRKTPGESAVFDTETNKVIMFGRDAGMYQEADRLNRELAGTQLFRSTHFDQPNILAHMRVNDRVVDGKKTLFIEEIQSDWHQAGRKRGYVDPNKKTYEVRLSINGSRVNADGETVFETREEAQALVDRAAASPSLTAEIVETRPTGIPDAPFKTSWHELTLKRAIQEASEKGYDQIAFTTGKTQAERYDLSKQIDEINVVGRTNAVTGEKSKSVALDTVDGQSIRLGVAPDGTVDNVNNQAMNNLIGKNLDEVVGKELAKKIMEGGSQTISGEGLKVGGEGMEGFYDNILPKSLEKLGKKFDAKVGKTQMDGVEVWQMDITPKMRETVTKQGQPLFQIGVGGGAAAGAATMQDNEERM